MDENFYNFVASPLLKQPEGVTLEGKNDLEMIETMLDVYYYVKDEEKKKCEVVDLEYVDWTCTSIAMNNDDEIYEYYF